MKKFLTAVFTALAAVIIAVAFAACGDGETTVVGTYKTHSVVMTQGEESITVNAGESYMGSLLEEDTYSMVIREDNTWTLTTKNNNGSDYVSDGTWADEDGHYSLSMPGETGSLTATLNGNLLSVVIMEGESGGVATSTTVVFEKV